MDIFVTGLFGFYFALALRECAIWVMRFQRKPGTHGRTSIRFLGCTDKDFAGHYPPVAIFHTICNDFKPDCFQSLLDVDYPNKAIFVLDDSRTDELRSFVEKRRKEVDFLLFYRHRETRRGNKAGNVNDGLSSLPESYHYVFLADSDQIVPRKMLARFVRFLEANSSVPFVQIHNKPTARPGDEIPDIVIDGHHVRALMSSRFVSMLRTPPCLGHGSLVRRWALTITRGLPEIVSEDIAWSLFLLSQGHRGAFYSGRFMGEAFPSTYCRFSKRFLRWCVADLECALRYLPRVVVSRHLSLVEKSNLVVGQLRYPSVPVGWALGIVICLTGRIPIVGASQISLTVCLLMGLLPVLVATRRIGVQTLTLLGHAIPMCFSQMTAALLECMRFAFHGKATFYVTGDQGQTTPRAGGSVLHLTIAAVYAAIMIRGSLHPTLVFFALCECVHVAHNWFPWSHEFPRLLRRTTVAWVVVWVLMAYFVGGVWLVEAHFLVVGLLLLF